MSSGKYDLAIAIGGAAGQGIAAPGDVLAWTFVRRGLHLYTYNAYQSIIRGGHIFWREFKTPKSPHPGHQSGSTFPLKSLAFSLTWFVLSFFTANSVSIE